MTKAIFLICLLLSIPAFAETNINEPTNQAEREAVELETKAALEFQRDYYTKKTEYNTTDDSAFFKVGDEYKACQDTCFQNFPDPNAGCEKNNPGVTQQCVERRNCLYNCQVTYTSNGAAKANGQAQVYVDYYMTGNETNYKGEAPTARPDSQTQKLKTSTTSYTPNPKTERVLFDDRAGSKQVPNFAHTLGISPEKGKVEAKPQAYTYTPSGE